MARAKNPRNGTPSSKQVISMSEATSVPSIRKKVGATTPTPIDLEEQIRLRAYEIWEERGRLPGTEEEDWKQAEREIQARNEEQFA
ncbi:MAG TPA: DUF2934 domain-containing protein [Terriglobales bacterium]|nr:DUF2934 domain-containing protein [Terriglobales bacterium]